MSTDRLSESDLRKFDASTDPEMLRLAAEVRRLRGLLVAAYEHVLDTPGTEELQAELEREVMEIRAEKHVK